MSELKRPAPPKKLGAEGKRVWKKTHDQLPDDRELEERELLYLEQACLQADEIVDLEKAIKRDGQTLDGRYGPRLNPLVPELRMARRSFQSLLGALDLPADEEPQTAAQVRARKAARTRWDKKKAGS